MTELSRLAAYLHICMYGICSEIHDLLDPFWKVLRQLLLADTLPQKHASHAQAPQDSPVILAVKAAELFAESTLQVKWRLPLLAGRWSAYHVTVHSWKAT